MSGGSVEKGHGGLGVIDQRSEGRGNQGGFSSSGKGHGGFGGAEGSAGKNHSGSSKGGHHPGDRGGKGEPSEGKAPHQKTSGATRSALRQRTRSGSRRGSAASRLSHRDRGHDDHWGRHHHHRHYPRERYVSNEIWLEAPAIVAPFWLAPYEPYLYPSGTAAAYGENNPYAGPLHCITQSCIQNYGEASDAVDSCICQGVRSSCAHFPTSALCTEIVASLPAEAMSCSSDPLGADNALWQRASASLDIEACG